MNFFISSTLLATFVLFAGCKDSQEQATEIIKTQTELSSQSQVQAENENLERRSAEMEQDLSARHRFFQAMKGRFEGSFTIRETEYKIRLTLTPNIAPYDFRAHRRFRRLEEIASDLNHLSFSVQVVQWNPKNPLSAVSCRVDVVRPDLRAGEITISNSNCPNLYHLKIVERGQANDADVMHSADYARRILDGGEGIVREMKGEIQPSTSSDIHSFIAVR